MIKAHAANLHSIYLKYIDLDSTIRSSQATPVYRAIAQLVEQVKKALCQKRLQQFSIGMIIPLSPVRVRLALFYKIIYSGAIAQWQSKESCQRVFYSNHYISVRIRIAPIGAVVQLDRTICPKALCQKRLQQLSSHHIGRRFEACQLRLLAALLHVPRGD